MLQKSREQRLAPEYASITCSSGMHDTGKSLASHALRSDSGDSPTSDSRHVAEQVTYPPVASDSSDDGSSFGRGFGSNFGSDFDIYESDSLRTPSAIYGALAGGDGDTSTHVDSPAAGSVAASVDVLCSESLDSASRKFPASVDQRLGLQAVAMSALPVPEQRRADKTASSLALEHTVVLTASTTPTAVGTVQKEVAACAAEPAATPAAAVTRPVREGTHRPRNSTMSGSNSQIMNPAMSLGCSALAVTQAPATIPTPAATQDATAQKAKAVCGSAGAAPAPPLARRGAVATIPAAAATTAVPAATICRVVTTISSRTAAETPTPDPPAAALPPTPLAAPIPAHATNPAPTSPAAEHPATTTAAVAGPQIAEAHATATTQASVTPFTTAAIALSTPAAVTPLTPSAITPPTPSTVTPFTPAVSSASMHLADPILAQGHAAAPTAATTLSPVAQAATEIVPHIPTHLAYPIQAAVEELPLLHGPEEPDLAQVPTAAPAAAVAKTAAKTAAAAKTPSPQVAHIAAEVVPHIPTQHAPIHTTLDSFGSSPFEDSAANCQRTVHDSCKHALCRDPNLAEARTHRLSECAFAKTFEKTDPAAPFNICSPISKPNAGVNSSTEEKISSAEGSSSHAHGVTMHEFHASPVRWWVPREEEVEYSESNEWHEAANDCKNSSDHARNKKDSEFHCCSAEEAKAHSTFWFDPEAALSRKASVRFRRSADVILPVTNDEVRI